MLNELVSIYFLNDLNKSLLALCDTLRSKDSLPFVIICLYNELQFHRAYFLIKDNPYLLNYKDIYILYVKIIYKLKLEPIEYNKLEYNKLDLPLKKSISIYSQSLKILIEAKLEKNYKERKLKLIESFKYDHRNLEALILLYENGINDIEINNLLKIITKPNLKNIYLQIFSPLNRKEIYSLFQAKLIISNDYKEKNIDILLQFGSYLLSVFPDSELGYLALGFHFILKGDYNKSKNFLYFALDLNKYNASVYIALGTANSLAYHREYANLAFKKALTIEPNNYKILFLLGREYFLSNYFIETIPLFKKAYEMSNNKQICYFYIMSLIRTNDNDTANKLLKTINDFGFWSVCHILEKNYSSAIDSISCMKDSFSKTLLMAIVTFLINCDSEETMGILTKALEFDPSCLFLKKLILKISEFDRKSMFAFFEDHLLLLKVVEGEFYWL